MENEDVTLIAKGNLFGSGAEGLEKENVVITNSEDWNTLMAQMDAVNKVSERFAETEIDFAEYTVIAVFDEVKSSGGHHIELEIIQNSEALVVYIKYLAPRGIATTMMTQPFYIVKLPKQDSSVLFK